jgi:hypothetical protein
MILLMGLYAFRTAKTYASTAYVQFLALASVKMDSYKTTKLIAPSRKPVIIHLWIPGG